MRFKFEELRVYQEAVALSTDLFSLVKSWPSMYRYTLGDQLLRAVLSISLNIAEGSSRTSRDFQHFLSVARGSCYECVPILTVAKKEKLISEAEFMGAYIKLQEIAKMLSALRAKV